MIEYCLVLYFKCVQPEPCVPTNDKPVFILYKNPYRNLESCYAAADKAKPGYAAVCAGRQKLTEYSCYMSYKLEKEQTANPAPEPKP